jgi:hypothetical protein
VTTLTKEQEQILDELFGPGTQTPEVCPAAPVPDLLATWLGLSGADLRQQLQALLAGKDVVEREVLAWLQRNPLDAAFEFLGGASLAFYLAEKDANPRVKSYVDAFYYIATCASVGYADIHAATQAGRAVAALVMIVGPSITARATDRPA